MTCWKLAFLRATIISMAVSALEAAAPPPAPSNVETSDWLRNEL
jgi:hypothetical protein